MGSVIVLFRRQGFVQRGEANRDGYKVGYT